MSTTCTLVQPNIEVLKLKLELEQSLQNAGFGNSLKISLRQLGYTRDPEEPKRLALSGLLNPSLPPRETLLKILTHFSSQHPNTLSWSLQGNELTPSPIE